MAGRRLEISNFLIGAAGGAVVALLYLWPLPFTLRGAIGVLAAGAIAGITLAGAAYLFRRLSGFGLYAAAAAAGAFGGAAWWAVVRPASTVFLAGLFGAVIVVVVLAIEMRPAEPGLR